MVRTQGCLTKQTVDGRGTARHAQARHLCHWTITLSMEGLPRPPKADSQSGSWGLLRFARKAARSEPLLKTPPKFLFML